MNYLLFFALCCSSVLLADSSNMPPYIQAQIVGIDQQLEQLQLSKQQLEHQLKSSTNQFEQQQIQAQITQIDRQIKFQQEQKTRLLNSGR